MNHYWGDMQVSKKEQASCIYGCSSWDVNYLIESTIHRDEIVNGYAIPMFGKCQTMIATLKTKIATLISQTWDILKWLMLKLFCQRIIDIPIIYQSLKAWSFFLNKIKDMTWKVL